MRTARRSGAAWLGVALGLLVLLTGCTQDPNVKKERHLERGLGYAAEGKHNEAIIELKNALQIDPKFVPALEALGRTYRAKAWYPDALRELRRAVELQPNGVDARIELGRVYLDLEAWDDARAQGEAVRERAPDGAFGPYLVAAALTGKGQPHEALELLTNALRRAPTTPDILRAHGDALAQLGRLDEAEKVYRTALAQDANSTDSRVALARLLLQRQDRQGARELLSRTKAADPGNPKARLVLSAALVADGKLAEAIKELEELPAEMWSARVVLALGELYVKAGRFESAVTTLSALVRRVPKIPVARYLLGHAFLGAKRPQEAVTEFDETLKLVPGNPVARYSLGVAYLQARRPREALKELEALARPMAKIPEYHLQVGRAYLALGRPNEAVKAAEAALKLAPDSAHPYGLLGAVYVREGNLGKAQEMYAKALEVDPNFAPGHVALGTLYSLEKKPEEALKEYEAALRIDPKLNPAVFAKVTTLVNQKRLDEAVRFVQTTLKEDPKNPRLRALLGSLHWLKNEPRKSEAEYRAALAVDEGFVPARYNLARLALAEKRDADAIAHLQRILQARPDHLPAVVLLVSLYSRQARYDRAIAALEAANRANPQLQDLTLLLAELYWRTGRHDDAIAKVAPLLAAYPSLVPARMLLGLVHLAKNNSGESIEQFERVKQLNPQLARNHYYLARAHAARGDAASAEKAYRQALQLEPNLREALIELAALTGDKPNAQAHAARVTELRQALEKDPTSIHLRYALAQAVLAQNRLAEAEAELQKILGTAPGFAPANFAMAVIRFRGKQPDEAAEYLKAVVRGDASHVAAHQLLGAYHENKGNRDQAVTHYETALRLNPTLRPVKLRLAHLYGQIGRVEDGLARAREVATADPKSATAQLVLGNLHLRRGDLAGAIGALAKAVGLDANLAGAHVSLGMAYQLRGDFDHAISAYRKSIALAPNDPRPYNNLAWLFAERQQNLDEALTLAQKAAALAPNNAAFLDTLGWVHYLRGVYADAARTLGKAAELASENAAIHYHLGMAYSRVGKKDDAVLALRRALQLDPKLPEARTIREVLAGLGG